MHTIDFETTINASREKVWKALWEIENYLEWVKPFSEDSRVETDNWKQGSEVRFTDGKGNGMLSRVDTNEPNKKMVFEHNAELKNNEVQPPTDKSKQWAGAKESYFLKENDGKTLLRATMDVNSDMEGYFKEKFPMALAKVKEIAER